MLEHLIAITLHWVVKFYPFFHYPIIVGCYLINSQVKNEMNYIFACHAYWASLDFFWFDTITQVINIKVFLTFLWSIFNANNSVWYITWLIQVYLLLSNYVVVVDLSIVRLTVFMNPRLNYHGYSLLNIDWAPILICQVVKILDLTYFLPWFYEGGWFSSNILFWGV